MPRQELEDRPHGVGSRITITIAGHYAIINGEWPRSLIQVVTRQHGSEGLAERELRGPYYRVEAAHQLLICAGLASRVERYLRRLDYDVLIRERTSWWISRLDAEQFIDIEQLPIADHEYVGQLTRAPRGQVIVQYASNIAYLIALLCAFYAKARIYIVAANRRRVAQLHRQLQQLLMRPISAGDDEPWHMPAWLYVGAATSFSDRLNADWDVVIFADVESALGGGSFEAVERSCDPTACHWPLRYCFRLANRQLHHDSLLDLEAVSGPEIYREPVASQPLRPVRLLLAHAPLTPVAQRYDSPLERKRRLVWDNQSRNAAIAAIAQAFLDRDLAALWSHGLLLNIADLSELESDAFSVAILVESPYHGRQLQQLLSGWRLVDAVPSKQRVRPTPMPCGHRTIATWEQARRVGFGADIVIRADGTATPWHPRFGPYRLTPYVVGAQFLVDFQDDVDPQAQWDTRRRMEDYASRGWHADRITIGTDNVSREHAR